MGCQFKCPDAPCPVEGDLRGELDAQKNIHGAAASAAERCDFCEKDSLLPVCRSWREHRPVYGPSLDICVVRKWLCKVGFETARLTFSPIPCWWSGLPPANAG